MPPSLGEDDGSTSTTQDGNGALRVGGEDCMVIGTEFSSTTGGIAFIDNGQMKRPPCMSCGPSPDESVKGRGGAPRVSMVEEESTADLLPCQRPDDGSCPASAEELDDGVEVAGPTELGEDTNSAKLFRRLSEPKSKFGDVASQQA